MWPLKQRSFPKPVFSIEHNLKLARYFRRMFGNLLSFGQISTQESENEKSMTTGSIICTLSFFFFSLARFIIIVAARRIHAGKIPTNLDTTEKFYLIRLLDNIAVILVSLNMSVAFIFFAIQNQQFRAILMTMLTNIKSRLIKTTKKVPANNNVGVRQQPAANSQAQMIPMADVPINQMPANIHSLNMKNRQFQLRREIGLQYGAKQTKR